MGVYGVILSAISNHGTQESTVEVSPQEAKPHAKGPHLDWSAPVLQLRWGGKSAKFTPLRYDCATGRTAPAAVICDMEDLACGSGVIGKSTKFGFEWKWPLMGKK
jgi:hypothetical protein